MYTVALHYAALMCFFCRLSPAKQPDTGIYYSEVILGLHQANEKCRYKVTPSLIG